MSVSVENVALDHAQIKSVVDDVFGSPVFGVADGHGVERVDVLGVVASNWGMSADLGLSRISSKARIDISAMSTPRPREWDGCPVARDWM